jgi:hypothetical protein
MKSLKCLAWKDAKQKIVEEAISNKIKCISLRSNDTRRHNEGIRCFTNYIFTMKGTTIHMDWYKCVLLYRTSIADGD